MKIKRYKAFEGKEELDPYGEEKWNDESTYNGNAVEFIQKVGDYEIKQLLDDMLASEDLDERMDIADQIITYFEFGYLDEYPELEDDIKDLAIA